MTDMWIKIILPGMNAIVGSLQGRVTEESFEGKGETLQGQINSYITRGRMFKLYDPIQLHPVPSPTGTSTMTVPLIQALEPAVTEAFIWVNGSQVQWWAPIECDSKWQQIIDQSIHGIAVPEAGVEIDEPDEDGGSNIIHMPGR